MGLTYFQTKSGVEVLALDLGGMIIPGETGKRLDEQDNPDHYHNDFHGTPKGEFIGRVVVGQVCPELSADPEE